MSDYVVIKESKEKLKVIEKNEINTTIKNDKGQIYIVPNEYLISYSKYLIIKQNIKEQKNRLS